MADNRNGAVTVVVGGVDREFSTQEEKESLLLHLRVGH